MTQETEARVHAARLDAAASREDAGSADRAAAEANLAYDEHYDAVGAADTQIDRIEEQADLIDQAGKKLLEADLIYGGDPPAGADVDEWVASKIALEIAAEDLVKQAEAISVDRRVIAVLVPTADDLAPTNDTAPNDTGLMDPNAPDDASPAPTTDGDALGLSLLLDDGDTADARGSADAGDAPDGHPTETQVGHDGAGDGAGTGSADVADTSADEFAADAFNVDDDLVATLGNDLGQADTTSDFADSDTASTDFTDFTDDIDALGGLGDDVDALDGI